MPKVEGGCLCGAVRYTTTADPVVVALCYCIHCQRQSGSAFSINVGIPKCALQISSGRTGIHADTGGSSHPLYRHFCGHGGSPICSKVVAGSTLDWVKAGALDE